MNDSVGLFKALKHIRASFFVEIYSIKMQTVAVLVERRAAWAGLSNSWWHAGDDSISSVKITEFQRKSRTDTYSRRFLGISVAFAKVRRVNGILAARLTTSQQLRLHIKDWYFCRLQAVLWRYKFSQLKGSSDDGKSKIKFLFQNQESKSIEAKVSAGFFGCVVFKVFLKTCLSFPLQELEFSNLFAVLHCIHAFFAAKVACLDPVFVESQGTATNAGIPSLSGLSCNSQTPKLKYTTWQTLLSLEPAKQPWPKKVDRTSGRWSTFWLSVSGVSGSALPEIPGFLEKLWTWLWVFNSHRDDIKCAIKSIFEWFCLSLNYGTYRRHHNGNAVLFSSLFLCNSVKNTGVRCIKL